ncbi:glycosyltransferase [Nocardioides sp. W7]|uniref:glycosyltransferase n=1 Tax=Nocardioides sp. W7 TaxID=2931390 RepID=UPI001FD311FC|nr:glycosyltransferase [Nocardioides sp. W7]
MSHAIRFDTVPLLVDRLIVHQFDAARPSPGGIDSCLRGICRYAPEGMSIAIVGVDTGGGPEGRALGRWEKHRFDDREIWFLPVASLDPGNQRRRVPHAARLVAGMLRYRRRLPKSIWTQAHRMDTGVAVRLIFRRKFAYFIHTQESGLTGQTSDSVWRRLGSIHHRLERGNVKHADDVVVFNEEFASSLTAEYPQARFSPTWYDPAILGSGPREPFSIVWVGRLEVPKDPMLAVETMRQLVELDPRRPWRLSLLGDGTEMENLRQLAAKLGESAPFELLGRVAPEDVMDRLSKASLFLMTSHPGYEGYPRVLVEALASGLPAVVTAGSDTGSLIDDGVNGFVTSRDPKEIASRLVRAHDLHSDAARNTAESLAAPAVIARIYTSGHVS